MNRLDRIAERLARQAARGISRRGLLARLGGFAAAASIPALPVARAQAQTPKQQPGEKGRDGCDPPHGQDAAPRTTAVEQL